MNEHVTADIAAAFDASIFGAALCKPFPIGSLHRDAWPAVAAWQERFHPTIKRRKPKKRKRK